MTAKEIFQLRQDGHVEEAYEAARQLYAVDKSPYASSAMFWTATDMLTLRLSEGCADEATKILLALGRLLPNVPDCNGWVEKAYRRCEQQLSKTHAQQSTPVPLAEHAQMGRWGEAVATDYLRSQGYVVLERDWHSGHRDIDIIACQDTQLVFVEVKTRQNTYYAPPEQAVDYKKRRHLRQAANHYVKSHHIDSPIRFDIITVVGSLGCANPTIEHLQDVDILQ